MPLMQFIHWTGILVGTNFCSSNTNDLKLSKYNFDNAYIPIGNALTKIPQ